MKIAVLRIFVAICAICLCAPAVYCGSRDLLAHGGDSRLWVAQVSTVKDAQPSYDQTELHWRPDFGASWTDMQTLSGRAVSIASCNGELAVVLDNGQWFLVNPDARQGPFYTDNVKMIAVANDQDLLWSLGIQNPTPTTAPTTSPSSTTLPATVPSTGPSTKPAPYRLVAYRFDNGKWTEPTLLPAAVPPNPSKISMAVINQRPIVAWLAEDDQTIQVIQLGNDHVWSFPRTISSPHPLQDFKLLAVQGKPALWLLDSTKDSKNSKNASALPASGGVLYAGDNFSDKIALALSAKLPGPGSPETLALAFSRLQLVTAADKGFNVQAYDLNGHAAAPVTHFTQPGAPVIEFQAWIAGSILILLAALVAGLSQRRRGPAELSPPPPNGRVQLAPLGRRFAAGVVDLLPLLAGYAVRQAAAPESMPPFDRSTVILLSLCIVTYVLHTLIAEVLCGQSIGKMLLNLRVVGPDGKPPQPGALVTRNLLRIIDVAVIFPLPLLTVLFTPLHQRFGDLAGGTVVISNDPESEEQPPAEE